MFLEVGVRFVFLFWVGFGGMDRVKLSGSKFFIKCRIKLGFCYVGFSFLVINGFGFGEWGVLEEFFGIFVFFMFLRIFVFILWLEALVL